MFIKICSLYPHVSLGFFFEISWMPSVLKLLGCSIWFSFSLPLFYFVFLSFLISSLLVYDGLFSACLCQFVVFSSLLLFFSLTPSSSLSICLLPYLFFHIPCFLRTSCLSSLLRSFFRLYVFLLIL